MQVYVYVGLDRGIVLLLIYDFLRVICQVYPRMIKNDLQKC